MFHVNAHASPEAPFCVGGGCLTVPSTSQLIAAGFDDVVTSTTSEVTAGSVMMYGAAYPRGMIERIAGPLALPGLLMMPVCWTLRARPSRVQLTVVVSRL